ncbi:MAG: DNA polymerase I [bacterium]|nr:MAG: DNA polymerase I [bacterium]
MTQSARLFLIDGSALFYRSYFAFIRNPLINSKGENTSAVFGFASSLLKILMDEKPDYLAVVFDTKEPTFRHQKYPEYKATREKMPEEMIIQYPRIIELVDAFDIPFLEKPGYEADDVIATLARQASEQGIETLMVTGDKDFMQLISPLSKMYVIRPGKDVEILTLDLLKERFNMTPEQVIDYLALMGDSSDNVPGVPGVGEKTAKELIKDYHDLDNLYQNLDKITKKALHQKLIEGKSSAYLSRDLVTIETQVPVKLELDKMKITKGDGQKIRQLFESLEFRMLQDRLRDFIEGGDHQTDTIDSQKITYILVNTQKSLTDFLKSLHKQSFFVFDTETTGLDVFDSEIIGLSFCWDSQHAYYIPLNDPTAEFSSDEVLKSLKPIFESDKIGKGGQNIKFDGLMLNQHGIRLKNMQFDTMIADYLLKPGSRQHNLDNLAYNYLNYKMIPIEELIGPKGKNQKNMRDIAVEKVSDYACEDADITYRLKELLEKELKSTETWDLFQKLEMPLVGVLLEMEKSGVKLDINFLKEMSRELEKSLQELEQQIFDDAKQTFNINSPQQLGKILFDELAIHKELGNRRPTRTATGQYSTSEQVLEKFAAHPLVNKILEYRKLTKLKSTYVDALPALVSASTGRLHTSFNQTIAATGRLSSSDPNLQNIPIRTEMGRMIRKAFIPGNPDHFILSADYSQIELRVMAHLSGDSGLKDAFKKGEDIHTSTAAAIFNIPLEMVNSDQRRKAKEVNFGIIYGISQYGLASRLNIPVEEARQIIENYFIRFPRVNDYMIHTIAFANKHKYVTTVMNRRRYLPEIESTNANVRQNAERMAINTTIQGSAADLIKVAMINIQKKIEQQDLQTRMILQVHDELVFEVKASELDKIKSVVKSEMEKAIRLDIPLKVDIGVGKNWLEAH